MKAGFHLGRALCILGNWLSRPGEALFWAGDRICWNALYGDSQRPDCSVCKGEGVTWATDGWGAWSLPCSSCADAQAIEAQRAETAKTGSVEDESAVAASDVPKGRGPKEVA